MKSITLVVEDRHDVYLKRLSRRWKVSRSWVLRRILDERMRDGIDSHDNDPSDIEPSADDA